MRREVFFWFSLGVLLFAGGFGLSYLRLARPEAPSLEDSTKVVAVEETLEEGAEVRLRYLMPDGSLAAELTEKVTGNLVGATQDQVQAANAAWDIVDFDPQVIVVEMLCSIPESAAYIGVESGMVAIFEGEPGLPCSRLRQITDVSVDSVHAAERAKLTKGIPFRDEDHRQQLVDGMVAD